MRCSFPTNVRATMAQLSKDFPQGMSYTIVYDPTVFVRSSIDAVVHTLLEAVLLVVLVVILFLQTWRASIIPLIAVPVSHHRHLRGAARVRILDQHPVARSVWCSPSASSSTTPSWSSRTSSATSKADNRRTRRRKPR